LSSISDNGPVRIVRIISILTEALIVAPHIEPPLLEFRKLLGEDYVDLHAPNRSSFGETSEG
jgi:hypothetical protein